MNAHVERFIATAAKFGADATEEQRRYDEQKRIGAEAIFFVRAMVDSGLVTAETYPSYFPAIRRMLADWAATLPRRDGVPYPEFCSTPDRCHGLSCCPRDPCCCD